MMPNLIADILLILEKTLPIQYQVMAGVANTRKEFVIEEKQKDLP
jgi:hypothetical protein